MYLVQSLLALICLVQSGRAQTLTRCNANNCLRQVRASAFPTRPTLRDCSAFQTPTAGVTPMIPAYASSCANKAEYGSACSCIGVTSKSTSASPTSSIGTGLPVPTEFGVLINYPSPGRLDINVGIYMAPGAVPGSFTYLATQSTPINALRFKFVRGNILYITSPAQYARDAPSVRYVREADAGPLVPISAGEDMSIYAEAECSIEGIPRQLFCKLGASRGIFAICAFNDDPTVQFFSLATNQAALDAVAEQVSCTVVTVSVTV